MGVLHDSVTIDCAFCGEVAETTCDDCGRAMCADCLPMLDDPDCPNDFCEMCLNNEVEVRIRVSETGPEEATWAAEQLRLRQARRRELESLIGRLVRLTHDIVTHDGDGVRRGLVLRVKNYYQGRYMLADPASGVLLVSGVVRPSFELVEAAA